MCCLFYCACTVELNYICVVISYLSSLNVKNQKRATRKVSRWNCLSVYTSLQQNHIMYFHPQKKKNFTWDFWAEKYDGTNMCTVSKPLPALIILMFLVNWFTSGDIPYNFLFSVGKRAHCIFVWWMDSRETLRMYFSTDVSFYLVFLCTIS